MSPASTSIKSKLIDKEHGNKHLVHNRLDCINAPQVNIEAVQGFTGLYHSRQVYHNTLSYAYHRVGLSRYVSMILGC